MATRSRPTTEKTGHDPADASADDWGVTVPRNGVIEHDDDPPEETAADRVLTVLESLRGIESARVQLHRVDPSTRRLTWCRDYMVEEFETGGFEMIRKDWGPGTYTIMLRGPLPSGRTGFRSRQEIVIAAPAVAESAPQQLAGIPGLGQFIQAMAESQQKILQALTERPAPPPAPDPMASMLQMAQVMGAMRQAFGPAESQKSSIGEIVAAIRELRGAADELSPPKPEPADDLIGMAKSVVDLVKTAAVGNPAAAAAAAPPVIGMPSIQLPPMIAQPAPQPAPQPVANEVAAPTEEPAEMSIEELRAAFAQLIGMAVENKPHEEAAEFVFEKLPDELIPVVRGEQWFEALSMIDPNISAHRDYLSAVREKLLAIFEEEGL